MGDELDLGTGGLEGCGEVREVEVVCEGHWRTFWGGGCSEEDFGDDEARCCCGLLG